MATYLSTLGQKLYSILPQNEHTRQLSKIEQEQTLLRTALTTKSGETFQKTITQTSDALQAERQKCSTALERMNGSFYQDPKSLLKKAWDRIVEHVKNALSIDVTERGQLDGLSSHLDSLASTPEREQAKSAIKNYISTEQKRDRIQAQMTQIVSSQKTGPKATELNTSLLTERKTLENRQKELCGSYFQDPDSLLDKAWKSCERDPALLDAYQQLDSERKSIETRLISINHQLSIPASSDRTIEVLSLESMTAQLQALEETKSKATNLAGIDWKQTAYNAAKLALVTGGYVLTQTLLV
ncbi:MAG: hypothetical protein JSS60_06435 [Verrucomicrobia bacterium]|nr:hypothetical protein [Verrucomicrobiota bacterium]